MRSSATDIRELLKSENVLRDRAVLLNAVTGIGNYCYVGAETFDRSSNAESYGELAVPLWRKFAVIFTRIRFKGLICQSETLAEQLPIANAGCQRINELGNTIDGPRVVWRFDAECAQKEPTRGLSVVFNNLWPSPHERGSLGFTAKERQVVLLASWAYDDDENAGSFPEVPPMVDTHDDAAKTLGMAPSTLKTHWQNIRTKFRSLRGWEEVRSTRTSERMVVEYCKQHPVELFGREEEA